MLNCTINSNQECPPPVSRLRGRLVAELATDARDIEEAQKLRHDVFRTDYGVIFDEHIGLDRDNFDNWCRHLLVRDQESGQVVATTRLLSDSNASAAGGFYSELEFDLQGLLANVQGSILEIGRTCVHPDFRSGAAITTLWSALADLLVSERYAFLMGCVSINLLEGVAHYQSVMERLRKDHWTENCYRVLPYRQVPEVDCVAVSPVLPPLLRTYMRMGAVVCGEACWDPSFNCADVLVLLDVAKLDTRYASRFMGRAVAA